MSFFLYPQVQLNKDTIKNFPGEMNTELTESGLNLSVGQGTANYCLARTVLRKNQILILDKATSNVDQGMELRSIKPGIKL